MGFKEDFIFGTSTASYQIEGANYVGGKGHSVWDHCSGIPGFTKDGYSGENGCSHLVNYKEDVSLMKKIGVDAYRMSISWPRVIADGVGSVNTKGLDFYDKLIDELLDANITPYITLFHWDYPYELYKRGGWLNNDSSDWFSEYARIIVDKLSDRVSHWITLNEPQCYIDLGHRQGIHAPGLKLSMKDVLLGAHNTLLAHGKAVEVIRKSSKLKAEIGYAPVGSVFYPQGESYLDIEAARSEMFSIKEASLWGNTWWMDPVFFGEYPKDGLQIFEQWLPNVKTNDMNIISQPLDFFGVNIYHGKQVRLDTNGGIELLRREPGESLTANKWGVTPEALYWGPKFFYERYKKPIIITENGMSNVDWISMDGKVHDPQRIDFIHRYIKEFKRAINDGVDGKGYFYWSLLDNFEWAEGYTERFGLVYVDYKTKKRVLKDSAYWYKELISNRGKNI